MRSAVASVIAVLLLFSRGGVASAQEDGWPEVFNPFRILTLNFELDSGTWEEIKRDTNYYDPELNIRVPCLMWAEGETNKLTVQIRRKSDSALPGEANPQKVSLKIDINKYVTGQEWRGLKKLSLENGGGGNGVLREGLAMNLHNHVWEHGFYGYREHTHSPGLCAWVRVVVNGEYVGLYASPEQRDKQFLRNRGMYNPGSVWFYEINGGTALDTTIASTHSPTFNHLCYLPFKDRQNCPQPDLETDLPKWVDMNGMLTLAAIETFIANSDGLFTKNGKNTFAADFLPPNNRKRLYFAWDLDAGFNNTSFNIYNGGPGPINSRPYQTQILAHYWYRDFYRHIYTDLLDGPLSEASLNELLDRLESALSPAMEEDTYVTDTFSSVRNFFAARIENVRGQIGAVTGPPRFSQNGGEIFSGFALALTHANAGGTIYYTLDGTDPRGAGGSPAGFAYSGPVTLAATTHVKARVLTGSDWSALREATFNVAGHGGGIRVTEIMFAPLDDEAARGGAGAFEFIELKNIGPTPVDLSNCEFRGIRHRFAPGTVAAPGAVIVLARNPAAFEQRYPGVPCHGSYFGGLSASGERIRLQNSDGNHLFSIEYRNAPPWPLGATGLGYSLVNINPDGDPDDPANWRASTHIHGSPGSADPEPPYAVGLVINEVLAHTDTPLEDAVEIYNPTGGAIDISGWYLSDRFNRDDPTGAALKRYRIPEGTVVPAGGYQVFYEGDFNPATPNEHALAPFAFSQHGEAVYLASADSDGNLTGHIAGARFGATENGVSIGRHITSVGADFTLLSAPTFGASLPSSVEEFRLGTGAANAGPLSGPVVINEVMYHPADSGTEFVELYNRSAEPVELGGWSLKGAGYVFPPNTTIAPNGFLVLLGATNPAIEEFREAHDVPASVPILARDFNLKNGGELLELRKPNDDPLRPPFVVDRARYNDKAPWPAEADGAGPSLERINPGAYGNDPVNWRTRRLGGSPGRSNESGSVIAIAANSRWKYHHLGHALGAAWRLPGYSDHGWFSGRGLLGFGSESVRTLLPVPIDGTRPVTTFFRKTFVVHDSSSQIETIMFRANYNDGFVAYLNGQEILRRSLPSGEINPDTLASPHPGGSYEQFDLTPHLGQLRRGINVLAVEVHLSSVEDADLLWDAELLYNVISVEDVDKGPVRMDIALENGALRLSFDTVAGWTFLIEGNDTLTEHEWIEIERVTGNGNTMSVTMTPSATGRFYRLRVTPN
jgi:spore coat protein CotH